MPGTYRPAWHLSTGSTYRPHRLSTAPPIDRTAYRPHRLSTAPIDPELVGDTGVAWAVGLNICEYNGDCFAKFRLAGYAAIC